MHSAVEEVDLDPCDLYLDLGALIVEGRIPGLSDRGFGEGPHCPPTAAGTYAQQPPQCRHHCNPEAPECQHYDQIKKHMLLLWKNGIPMSVEVLLYPNCCTALAPVQSVDTSSMPDMSYILLEQWTVHMLPRRVPDAGIHPRGLLQAIRSFLYFSQLCAWFSLTGGKSPQNVHYRVCVPGEAFSSRFVAPPETHVFPISNIGRNAAMKVSVKSQPRCGKIPVVICQNHTVPIIAQKTVKKELDLLEDEDGPLVGAEGEILDGVLPVNLPQPPSRTNSPADTMLGESLLDPPNSLCMYPKRYQSPSRCGSPSLEVPEHLMFGKGSRTKREAERKRMNAEMQNRSRSHQKSAIERSFKKSVNANRISPLVTYSERPSRYCYLQKELFQENPHTNIDLTNYLCEDLTAVPKAEMETVLHRLRNRCLGTRSPQDKAQRSSLVESSEKLGLLNDQLSLESDLREAKHSKLPHRYNKPFTDAKTTSQFLNSSKSKDQTEEKVHIDIKQEFEKYSKHTKGRYKGSHSKCLPPEYIDDQPVDSDHAIRKYTNAYNESFLRIQGSYPNTPFMRTTVQNKKQPNKNSKHNYNENSRNETYQLQNDVSEQPLPSSLSGVNIKKCGTLLQSMVLSDKLIDERGVSHAQHSSLLQKLLKSSSQETPYDELDPTNSAIPSAEEKAQFRRSLDSATSLVFHKKSGLPLTSSPAPIRKSGTCFDFDSSLTSVSAIKRALFEKEPEDGETERIQNLPTSISAPSSMTVSSLLGTFEESVLNGRLEPVSTVEGFTAEIGASGSFCPRHITLPVTIFFYTLQDIDKVTSPYLGHINLGKREYHVPKSGTVQVTLFNPHRTVVKMFVVRYDLSDMPPNCQTFLRQRTLYMPTDASENDSDAQKWLRYLIHLRFFSSKSGRIYLHTDLRMIIFRKSDLDAATVHGQRPYELRSFTQGPINPKFSPHKP